MTLYHCPKCNTRDHYATDVCPKDAGAQADRNPPSELAQSVTPASELKKVGRPRLNRTPEEKLKLRREYLRKYREGKK